MPRRDITLANRTRYCKITIPAVAATLHSLILAGLIAKGFTALESRDLIADCKGFRLLARLENGSDRAAINIGDGASFMVESIAAGEEFAPNTFDDIDTLYVITSVPVVDAIVALYC